MSELLVFGVFWFEGEGRGEVGWGGCGKVWLWEGVERGGGRKSRFSQAGLWSTPVSLKNLDVTPGGHPE